MRLYRKLRRNIIVARLIANGLRSLWLEWRVGLNERRAARLEARQDRVDAFGFELERRLGYWD